MTVVGPLVPSPEGLREKTVSEGVDIGRTIFPSFSLNVVNVNLLLTTTGRRVVRLLVRVGVAKLKVGLAILALVEGIRLVDLGVLGQLAVRLEGTGLVGRVLEDHVALAVLEVTEGEEDDVTLVDPDLFAHLATDVGESL